MLRSPKTNFYSTASEPLSYWALFFLLAASWQNSASLPLFSIGTAAHSIFWGFLVHREGRQRLVMSGQYDPLFSYLWQNHTDLFCFKSFTANSSGKNIEEIKITNVGKWWRLQTFTKFFPSYSLGGGSWVSSEGRNWNFPLNSVLWFYF